MPTLPEILSVQWAPDGSAGSERQAPICPCAQYAPALQLRVLGLEAARLEEPILDLGCGARAAPEPALREVGKEAYGIDRGLSGEPFCFDGDWLDFPIEPGRWGTLISHMGFSNHFLHHHLRPGLAAERYARRYMELLGGLRPGGSLVYAPGLPFLEPLLPAERFAVLRHDLSELVGSSYDQQLRDLLGDSVFYSCQVRVLG
jgi:hypothetical protein